MMPRVQQQSMPYAYNTCAYQGITMNSNGYPNQTRTVNPVGRPPLNYSLNNYQNNNNRMMPAPGYAPQVMRPNPSIFPNQYMRQPPPNVFNQNAPRRF